MIAFSPYWIYYISLRLQSLYSIGSRDLLSIHLKNIVALQGDIEKFLKTEQHALFPDTNDSIQIVLDLLMQLVPSGQPFVDRAIDFNSELMPLMQALGDVTKAFERDCKRAFIAGLERQRALDLYVLIQSIETAFSERAWKRFSRETRRELWETGQCLGFERYTASGFHALRAVETVIRQYIVLLTQTQPIKRDWGFYLETLRSKGADAKLLATLEDIRRLDRNPLMHPEDWLDQDEAIALFNTSTVALERLVADMERKKLFPVVAVSTTK